MLRRRILSKRREKHLDGLFELGIAARAHSLRILFDLNVGCDSHIFGDPQFQGPPGASLAFDCKGGFDTNGITITFAEGEWLPRGVNYKAKVAQQDVTGGWKTVIVPLSKFVSDAGATPANWSKVDRLLLSGATTKAGPPLFSRFRWVFRTAQ